LHDARVFGYCEIQKRFSDGKVELFYKELLPGEECVPQLLLGDPAYPLLPYVMKEFATCSSNEEVIFNQMMCSARNQIECAFGRLKARWRILLRPMDIPVRNLPNVIFACFVLHNFCERRKVDVDASLVEKIIMEERLKPKSTHKINTYTTPMGKRVRNTITSYFKEYL
jgi:Plant transposon protein.